MIVFDSKTKKQLIDLFDQKKIGIEGNILKLIDVSGDEKFAQYIQNSIEKDKENRKKRLEVTKQVQIQNKELSDSKSELEESQKSLEESLEKIKASMEEAESSREQAEQMRIEAEQARQEAEKAKEEAELAKEESEMAREKVENDLDVLQKRTQNELIGTIVKVALFVICGVGFVTTAVYLLALFTDKDTQVIASTWANIVGILLTNAFSIVGTIMGVKYASEK
jgi:DNA repair exonuclease SbcCD ATPase subunit